MAAAPAAAGRKPKEDLTRLIADIGDWLKGGDGTSLDGGSSGGGAGGNEPHVIERFRLVLPRVLDTVLDPTRGAWTRPGKEDCLPSFVPHARPALARRSASRRRQGVEAGAGDRDGGDSEAPGGLEPRQRGTAQAPVCTRLHPAHAQHQVRERTRAPHLFLARCMLGDTARGAARSHPAGRVGVPVHKGVPTRACVPPCPAAPRRWTRYWTRCRR